MVVLLFQVDHDGAVRLLRLVQDLVTGAVPFQLLFIMGHLIPYRADRQDVVQILLQLKMDRLQQARRLDTLHDTSSF